MDDLAIIGAGTAGMTAAIYARRAGKTAVIYEAESYGGQIINTPDIENYPGIKHVSGFEFATDLYEQTKALGAEFVYDNVTSIEGDADNGFRINTEFSSEPRLARTVILACGAKNRHMGIADEERLSGRGVSYCATCDGSFFKGKPVAVFGGGNTALEDALYLSDVCSKVYIIHRRDEFRGEAALVDLINKRENIETVLSCVVSGLIGEKQLEAVEIESTKDSSKRTITVDGLFVAIGQIPSNGAFSSFVELDDKGYVVAKEDCITSRRGVFTAGDGRTKAIRQLTTAAADGAVAALACCDFINRS